MELQTEDLKKVLINQESKLADKILNKKKEAILKHITDLSDESKNLSNLKVWKLKRKVYPKQLEKPSAKLDKNGKLVTEKTKGQAGGSHRWLQFITLREPLAPIKRLKGATKFYDLVAPVN